MGRKFVFRSVLIFSLFFVSVSTQSRVSELIIGMDRVIYHKSFSETFEIYSNFESVTQSSQARNKEFNCFSGF